jgi:hypothetical protein
MLMIYSLRVTICRWRRRASLRIHRGPTKRLLKHALTRFLVSCKYLAREGSRVSLVFPLDIMHKLRPFVCILGTWERLYEQNLSSPARPRFSNFNTPFYTNFPRKSPDDHNRKPPQCMHTHKHLRISSKEFLRASEVYSSSSARPQLHNTMNCVSACSSIVHLLRASFVK